MSYLDTPRIQFGGLFFTNPDTMNNYIYSYAPDLRLENPDGSYRTDMQNGGPGGWYPVGLAQLWIEQCKVLSAVGPAGPVPGSDPIIGAPVESPSPTTPLKTPDGNGFYDIAKMVDLDPDQQGRSAVYGLRLQVTLPDDAGFSGALTIPELQYMGMRVRVRTGSWMAIGTWMGKIEQVAWQGDVSASPFLKEFQGACSSGIAVKLAVDLHQNNPATKLTAENEFFYGRVSGSMGPARSGELAQAVPVRRMVQPKPPVARALPLAEADPKEIHPGVPLDERMRRLTAHLPEPGVESEAQLEALSSSRSERPWLPVFAQLRTTGGRTTLQADIGNSILLQHELQQQDQIFSSDGRLLVDSGITVGFKNLQTQTFVPFAHGQVSFQDQYQLLASPQKKVNLLRNAGIVDIPLADGEVEPALSNPLAVTVDGDLVVCEPDDGIHVEVSVRSLRLEPGTSRATFQISASKFSQPVIGQQPVTWQVDASPNSAGGTAPGVLSIQWLGVTDKDGVATLQVSAAAGTLTLPPARKPLDSLVYYITLSTPDGPISDGGGAVSVLLFNEFNAPASPGWNDDVGPILKAYARLYPGMKGRLDIGDESTVKGFAQAMHARMSAPFEAAGYMPVTRDLAPAKVQMILDWLKQFVPSQRA